MIANPGKFQAIILGKQKHDYWNKIIKFVNKTIKNVSSVRLLGLQLQSMLVISNLEGTSQKVRDSESSR